MSRQHMTESSKINLYKHIVKILQDESPLTANQLSDRFNNNVKYWGLKGRKPSISPSLMSELIRSNFYDTAIIVDKSRKPYTFYLDE